MNYEKIADFINVHNFLKMFACLKKLFTALKNVHEFQKKIMNMKNVHAFTK